MRLRFCALLALVGLVATGCHAITPPGPAPVRYRDEVFSSVTTTTGISYGSAVDQAGNTVDLKLDLYQPTGDPVTSRPAIVWVHGGGFSSGTRTSPEIVDEATTFAKKGFVNVSISYRLTPGGCSAGGVTPACVRAILDAQSDAQAAVRFLRRYATTYRVDKSRMAIGGTSAGAITALQVGANSESPGTSGNPGFSSGVRAAVALSGAEFLGAPMSTGDAAILMFHGTTDTLVLYDWAVNTLREAQAGGLVSYLTTFEGEGHVPYNHRNEILAQTTNFLYWILDLAHAAH